MAIQWHVLKFDEFSLEQLYKVLHLRSEIFVVEQDCVYQDVDNKDQQSIHLLGYEADALVAYARLLPPGLHYTEASIGRVVTHISKRGTGLGTTLMEEAIKACEAVFGEGLPIRIEAQTHLERFYGNLGFRPESDSYMMDGIPHTEMLRLG
ncbi:MAG: GNAT family N-acetyltransferase [Bacteroidia bacterium]